MEKPSIEVFYDGNCPVCRLEVELYQKFGDLTAIKWVNIVSLEDHLLPDGKDRDELLNRFHVRDERSDWHIGVDAFARIWRQLPVLRHIAFVFRVPGLRQLAQLGYLGFLRWQRWHRKTQRDTLKKI